MWKCKKCGEESGDTFDSCWSCGTSLDGTQSVDIKEFKSIKEDVVKRDNFTDYTTKYSTARMISQFVSFVGWVVVSMSVIIFLVYMAKGSRNSFAMIGLFPSLGGVISGLLLVMAGQMTRATVDTADNTGHMLDIMKKRKWK